MKRYEFDEHGDPIAISGGEWIRYSDHVEAMKRIAGASPAALTDAPYRKLLAALVDIHDDAWDHAPEHRTYVECAFNETIDEARALLAASPADQGKDARDALMLELLESYEAIFRSAYCQLDADDDLIRRVRAAMSASKEGVEPGGWKLVPVKLPNGMAAVLTDMLTQCHTVEESYADLLRAAPSPNKD